ncbi:hypothetical protein U1Q18_031428 [Sarracenia purpurea var. burkii]
MATTTAPGGYTTIPPSTPPPPPLSSADFYSRTAQIGHSIATTLRPWREFFSPSALSLPISFSEATFRIKNNLHHFRLNYTIIALIILFLSLIYHPISIMVFLITLVAWFFLHISRDEPLTLFNRTIDDRVVVIVLSAVTILALILTRVWLNVVVSMLVSALVACLHAVVRFPDDVDDQESPYAALFSVVDSPRGAYSQV